MESACRHHPARCDKGFSACIILLLAKSPVSQIRRSSLLAPAPLESAPAGLRRGTAAVPSQRSAPWCAFSRCYRGWDWHRCERFPPGIVCPCASSHEPCNPLSRGSCCWRQSHCCCCHYYWFWLPREGQVFQTGRKIPPVNDQTVFSAMKFLEKILHVTRKHLIPLQHSELQNNAEVQEKFFHSPHCIYLVFNSHMVKAQVAVL